MSNVSGDGPTFDLGQVQRLVRIGQWTHTYRAARDAAELRFDRVDIRECVLGLGPDDFVRTAESRTEPGTMQDAYKPVYCGVELYVKLQISSKSLVVVISFHSWMGILR